MLTIEEALYQTDSGPLSSHCGPGPMLKEEGGPLEDEISVSEEWLLARRVAASKGLSKSSLLPKFLLYICEQSLQGNSRQLTEQRIGTVIFNRAPDYNPGDDNIVRSYARTLRRRLDEYFETEGRDEPMRLVIPRGGYVPTFERVTSEAVAIVSPRDAPPIEGALLAVAEVNRDNVRPRSRSSSRSSWMMVLFGFLAGVVVTASVWAVLRTGRLDRAQSASHPLWAELFRQNLNTLIVPADSGLGILQNLSGVTVPLQEYADGSYLTDTKLQRGINPGGLADLRQQRYTSVVDLDITTRLMQLPEISGSRTQIRYARSITTEDLKASDVILLGSVHSNPWVALFEDKLNFKLKYRPEVNQSFVLNEHPVGDEQKQYVNGNSDSSNQTFGVIDYLPNLDGSGHVLIIQGLNMAATQAAADTLFRADVMKPILKEATGPNGTLGPFELLIKTSSIGAIDPGSQIIATRF